jgi:hypothetical protein
MHGFIGIVFFIYINTPPNTPPKIAMRGVDSKPGEEPTDDVVHRPAGVVSSRSAGCKKGDCESVVEVEGIMVAAASSLCGVAPLLVGRIVRGMGLAVDGIPPLHGSEHDADMSSFNTAGAPLPPKGQYDVVVKLSGDSALGVSARGRRSVGHALV